MAVLLLGVDVARTARIYPEYMHASGRWSARFAWPMGDLVVAAGTAVATCLPMLGQRHAQPPGAPVWTAGTRLLMTGVVLAGCAALTVRRRWPVPVLVWIAVVAAAAVPIPASIKFTSVPLIVASYTVAAHRPWPLWAAGGAVAGLGRLGVDLVGGSSMKASLSGLIWVAAPLAAGIAVRNRRGYLAAIRESARQAEASKEQEARRRVVEERVRIARELHDILAHSIAVISIQSGFAAHLIHRQPHQAEQALWHINDASHVALAELRATIGLLRDQDEDAVSTRPLPDLGDLDELVAQIRATGLTVRTHLAGDLTQLPPKVGLVGYRIVQEALTNVLKHAHARTVDLSVVADEHRLCVDVRDDGRGAPDEPDRATAGHGRIGMQERVHAVGGVFRDGPVSPGYRVHALIPIAGSTT